MKERVQKFIYNLDVEKLNKEVFDENDYEIINYLWNLIRDDNQLSLQEIKQFLELNQMSEKYEKLINYVKSINEEYYDFEFFRNKNIEQSEKILLLETIMKKAILVNNIDELKQSKFTSLNEETMSSLIKWLTILVGFCVNNNYPGNKIQEILLNSYRVDLEISQVISELYEQNKILLKLNYIIAVMEDIKIEQ